MLSCKNILEKLPAITCKFNLKELRCSCFPWDFYEDFQTRYFSEQLLLEGKKVDWIHELSSQSWTAAIEEDFLSSFQKHLFIAVLENLAKITRKYLPQILFLIKLYLCFFDLFNFGANNYGTY